MARDESTEGWLPLQGGGLANVSIRKRARLPHVSYLASTQEKKLLI
jgi:hypothetical protein